MTPFAVLAGEAAYRVEGMPLHFGETRMKIHALLRVKHRMGAVAMPPGGPAGSVLEAIGPKLPNGIVGRGRRRTWGDMGVDVFKL